ncbi:MAG TPA: MiaB/RimO family radical SAM methylthiotransferase [Candidatus Coatesbacteria bacterium]|nr:MiaB/RimO family radical SAM methylthiotransferase [Candidatus Coatesbacteria bacterium]
MRVAVASLGCKMNAGEAEATLGAFIAAGYRPVKFGEPAEVCVVHTCTVTGRADCRSRSLLRRAAGSVVPGGRLIAAGCYAATDPELLGRLPGVTDVLPLVGEDLLSAVQGRAVEEKRWPEVSGGFLRRTRAFLEVQDGCDGACSYCKVRLARGRARSRPIADARAALERLVAAGHREVVLTGVHLGAWGRECGAGLTDLLRALLEIPGLARLRLSSIEPDELTAELIDLAADSGGKIAPHFHVPLQSGADGVLRRMNRPYTAGRALENIGYAARRITRLGLGLDVMVGFPGETEADFTRTVEAVEKSGAAYLHVFSFSPRTGTAAEHLGDRVPSLVKKERSRALRALSAELAHDFAERNMGARVRLLVERRRSCSGKQTGVTGNYLRGELGDAPENLGGRLVLGEVVALHPEPSLTRPGHGPATVLVRFLKILA